MHLCRRSRKFLLLYLLEHREHFCNLLAYVIHGLYNTLKIVTFRKLMAEQYLRHSVISYLISNYFAVYIVYVYTTPCVLVE